LTNSNTRQDVITALSFIRQKTLRFGKTRQYANVRDLQKIS